MKFFSENSDAFEQGIFGVTVSIHAPPIQLPPSLPAYVREFQHKCGKCETAFDLVYISKEKPPDGVYCGIHGHIEEEKLTQMTLSLNRKPESDPPKKLAEDDQKLGGFPSGFHKFLSFFPGQTYECRIKLVLAVVDTRKWKPPVSRHRKSQALAGFSITHQTVNLSQDGCQVELSFHKGLSGCTVEIQGTTALVLNESCFDNAAQALWTKIETLFRPHL